MLLAKIMRAQVIAGKIIGMTLVVELSFIQQLSIASLNNLPLGGLLRILSLFLTTLTLQNGFNHIYLKVLKSLVV